MNNEINVEPQNEVLHYHQNEADLKGSQGLPVDYPIPHTNNLLFYIQRNLNENTVVYNINLTADGHININDPISAYWIRYTDGGIEVPLNYVQEKLAYGFTFHEIAPENIEVQIVSYPAFRIFISRNKEGEYNAYARINGEMAILTNMYVYAVDFGVFPEVKFIDIHGKEENTDLKKFQKIKINN